MDRYTDLSVLLDHIWTYVEEASTDSSHSFRTPAFATAGMDSPNVRTVVLRHADRGRRALAFHTDRRTAKVAEVRANRRIMWHGWDKDRSEQLRLHGKATVHTGDDVADALWTAGTPEELHLYMRPRTPGTPMDEPGDGLADAVQGDLSELTMEDVAEGRRYFAVVRTVIDEIHWLHLHPDGQYRARFRYDPSQEDYEGDWLVP